jgi:hypothetical protein
MPAVKNLYDYGISNKANYQLLNLLEYDFR